MKHTLFIIMLAAIPLSSYCQKLTKDETDKFLKTKIKETSWEPLKVKLINALRFRLRSIDGVKYIETSVTFHSVFRVDEGDRMYFLFNDSLSLPVECTRGGVADYHYSKYGSYWNGSFLYKIPNKLVNAISEYDLTGVRIGMGGEYYIFDDIKKKNAEKLRNAISLVD